MAANLLKKKVSAFIKKVKELQGSPSYLARGAAIGIFVAFAPISPLKTVSIITLALLFKGSVLAGILICTAICNPFTYIILYYTAWLIGDFLLPGRASWDQLEAAINQMQQSPMSEALTIAGQVGVDAVLVILTGGIVLAIPLAFLSYPLCHKMFTRFSKREKVGDDDSIGDETVNDQ